MELLLLAIVIGLFFFINKGYDAKDYQQIKINVKQQLQGKLEDHEAGLLVALMAKVAKADGGVCELEAEVLSNTFTDISLVFENDKEIREQLKQIYKKEKESFDNTIEVSKKYLKLTKRDYQKRLKVLEYLLNLAFIDGDFSDTEFMIIEDIANAIEIKQQDFESLVSHFKAYYEAKANDVKLSMEKAYEVLGVDASISDSELKKHYRKLVKAHHPDIITGQGADQSSIDEATAKLQEINEAYELIKKDRGN
jgi:DnaJ like chaperone protein